MLTLRPASAADARLLWTWANEPSTRAASFHSASIPWSDHERWLDGRMKDPCCRLFVASADGRPVGQIRFELAGVSAEVNISVSDVERGHGYGSMMLRLGCQALEGGATRRVIAHVKPENVASLRLFERAGFTRQGRVVVSDHEAERFERVLSP